MANYLPSKQKTLVRFQLSAEARLVKLVNTADLKSVPNFYGYRFKSDSEQIRLGSSVVEQWIENPYVGGSSPPLNTYLKKDDCYMPTIRQFIQKKTIRRIKKLKFNNLQKCPQKQGVCLRVYTTTPKKPNSAIRKIAKVRNPKGGNCRKCRGWGTPRPVGPSARNLRAKFLCRFRLI